MFSLEEVVTELTNNKSVTLLYQFQSQEEYSIIPCSYNITCVNRNSFLLLEPLWKVKLPLWRSKHSRINRPLSLRAPVSKNDAQRKVRVSSNPEEKVI